MPIIATDLIEEFPFFVLQGLEKWDERIVLPRQELGLPHGLAVSQVNSIITY